MPELPEVESLAAFLRGHAVGHAVTRADAASFSALKTFAPPLVSLSGQALPCVGSPARRAAGRAVPRAVAASFSVLKTFDPPLVSLSGQVLTNVGRHGKF